MDIVRSCLKQKPKHRVKGRNGNPHHLQCQQSKLSYVESFQLWKLRMIYAPNYPMLIFYSGYNPSDSKYKNGPVKKHSKVFPIVPPA